MERRTFFFPHLVSRIINLVRLFWPPADRRSAGKDIFRVFRRRRRRRSSPSSFARWSMSVVFDDSRLYTVLLTYPRVSVGGGGRPLWDHPFLFTGWSNLAHQSIITCSSVVYIDCGEREKPRKKYTISHFWEKHLSLNQQGYTMRCDAMHAMDPRRWDDAR